MNSKIYLCILLIPFCLFGQKTDQPSLTKTYKANKLLKLADEPIALQVFFSVKSEVLGLGKSEMRFIKQVPSKNNTSHYKYQQYYNQFPVFNNIYILHEKVGNVFLANGSLYPNIDISTQVLLGQEDVFQKAIAKHFIQSKKDAFDKSIKKQTAKLISSELVVTDRIYPNFSGRYTMAYLQVLESRNPLRKVEYLIDANTGRIIFSQSKIHYDDRPSKARTKYYGTQTIISDSIAPDEFILRDNGRNIQTYTSKNLGLEEFVDEDGFWDQFNADLDEVALDAHYCTSRFYDMMLELFDYKGIDGDGSVMDPVVHADGAEELVNAYWDGANAYFGNGDCLHGPLTTLSVVAHEFTHGITEANSNLDYEGESGAINESYSDIFGKACEYIYDSLHFSWELDPTFNKVNYSGDFRSFSDPNRLEMPKAYGGKYWLAGADVHVNSSVLNHWYYLLVTGGTSVNEFGNSYSITKVPFRNILEVLFLCQTSFLTPTSDYAELKELSLEACDQLFGQGQIYKSMEEAWKAVNVDGSNSNGNYNVGLLLNLDSTQYCSKISVPKYSISIMNLGLDLIPKNTAIGYAIYYESDTKVIQDLYSEVILKEDLLPGDELNIDLTGNLVLDFYGAVSLVAVLSFGNPENAVAFDFGFTRNFNPQKNDLSLELVDFGIFDCNTKEVITNYRIKNLSCSDIAPGDNYTVQFKDATGVIHKETRTVPSSFIPGQAIFIQSGFDYPNRNLEVTASLIFSKDLDNTNNVVSDLHYNLLDVPKKFAFNDLDHENYFVDFNFVDPIYKAANENYFASTGLSSSSKFLLPPCPELERNFNLEESGFLATCLDASKLGRTSISFDLIQYRTDSSKFKEFNEKTSIFQLHWSDDNMNEFQKLIYDQAEGQKKSYTFSLPDNFQGLLDLNFYTRQGLATLNKPQALNYDVILLDNLEFKTITSNNESLSDKKLVLETNPSKFYLSLLGNTADVESYRILNSLGQLVRNIESSDRNRVDISSLIEGYYLLEVIFNNSKKQVLPFVKN